MLKKCLKNESGMALALIMMIFAVLVIVAASGLSIAMSQTKDSVSNEDYTESYYIARSAADIVSTDIIKKVDNLNKLKNNVDNASEIEKEAQLDIYNSALSDFNNLGVLPAYGSIKNVTVSIPGVAETTVKVYNSASGDIELSSTFMKNGRSSTSKVKLGKITTSTTNVAIALLSNQYGMMADKILTLDGAVSVSGSGIAYSGSYVPPKGKGIRIEPTPVKPINEQTILLTKPDYIDIAKDIPANAANIGASGVNIYPNNNGFYDRWDEDINWNVHTESGDVILGFSTISKTNNGSGGVSINVHGDHNFYLFLIEDSSSDATIFNTGNSFNIKSVSPSNVTKAYIITVPMDKGKTLKVFMKNNGTIDAHFCLINAEFDSQNSNQGFIKGSIYAKNITTDKMNLNFTPYGVNSIVQIVSKVNGNMETTVKAISIIERINLNNSDKLDRIWTK